MYSKLIQSMLNISPATYSYRKNKKSWTVTDLLLIREKLEERGIKLSLEKIVTEYLGY